METVEHVEQLVVTELEGRGREEQHLLEHVPERSLQRLGVLLGFVVVEESSQPVRVLDVVGFVEDQQWQVTSRDPRLSVQATFSA